MTLSNNELYPILVASQLLDKVEAALRSTGNDKIANDLVKLQQDANAFTWYDAENAATGPDSAQFIADYKPVTAARLNRVLQSSYDRLAAGTLKQEFGQELKNLLVPVRSAIYKNTPTALGR